jgi:hypothetical protein
MTDERTLKDLAQEAIDVQDAVNLSGVALAFGRTMRRLWAFETGGGTESMNTHPIVRMFLSKMLSLSRMHDASDGFSEAYKWCLDTVKED